MARKFEIPSFYRSPIVSTIKAARRSADQMKRDLSPTILDLGPVRFKIARHFGFCFGVENAIEIAYRAIAENLGRRIFLLSEMIHNPQVNADLLSRGVRFLISADGRELVPFEEIGGDDVVIVPAFGTTVEIFERLEKLGVNPLRYNTTCPFVEKVWTRAQALGDRGYSIVIHGKRSHEETRATFSHAQLYAPSVVVRNLQEAKILAAFITGMRPAAEFLAEFADRHSVNFDPQVHLSRVGVVNQTTMLAEETQAISDLLRDTMRQVYGEQSLAQHFADTRDTLCYATTENQAATRALIQAGGDLALVVGGHNSSNTSHLVELLSQHCPTYFIRDPQQIEGGELIRHLRLDTKEVTETRGWLPKKTGPTEILVTAGASCPDRLIEEILLIVAQIFGAQQRLQSAVESFELRLRSHE